MTATGGDVRPQGDLFLKVIRGEPVVTSNWQLSRWRDKLAATLPGPGLSPVVNEWRERNGMRVTAQMAKIATANQISRLFGVGTFWGELYLDLIRGDGSVEPLGLAGMRVVTTAGVTDVCTRFAGTSAASIANYKFHGFGTGTGAEASSDTALGTEFTTEYATDNTRPTGSQSASTNTYSTVATFSPDSGGTLAVTEHGLFSATSSTTLLDRTKFSAVNLVASSDSLQATYVLTLSAGG